MFSLGLSLGGVFEAFLGVPTSQHQVEIFRTTLSAWSFISTLSQTKDLSCVMSCESQQAFRTMLVGEVGLSAP
jgi:hypothetical protein